MGAAILVQAEGRSVKPSPAAKADLESLFIFQSGEKSSMYRGGYTSGFSPL
jgi:hypothetical protein